MIWINNGLENKFIDPSNFHLYENYKKGRIQKKIWINNGIDNKYILPEFQQLYEGYKRGRLVPWKII